MADRPVPVGPSPRSPGPAGPALAALADRCAAAAAEVTVVGCPVARMADAAETLDVALGEVSRWDAGLAGLAATRDAAGDLLAALSAAGLGPADRMELQTALARLLADAAAEIRAHRPE